MCSVWRVCVRRSSGGLATWSTAVQQWRLSDRGRCHVFMAAYRNSSTRRLRTSCYCHFWPTATSRSRRRPTPTVSTIEPYLHSILHRLPSLLLLLSVLGKILFNSIQSTSTIMGHSKIVTLFFRTFWLPLPRPLSHSVTPLTTPLKNYVTPTQPPPSAPQENPSWSAQKWKSVYCEHQTISTSVFANCQCQCQC